MNEVGRESNLFDMAGYQKRQVQVGDRTVVYFTNAGGKGVPPDNNLFILDSEKKIVWDMSRVLKSPDTAVMMKVEEGIMYFTTFSGVRFGIDTATLDVVEKKIVK